MAATKLTDLTIGKLKAAPGERLRRRDGLIPGLEIRVTDRGVKTWRLLYRYHGRQRPLTIGRWPIVNVSNARAIAKSELLKIAQGIDPAAKKVAERNGDTFEAVAAEFVAKYAKVHHRRWHDTEQTIKTKLLPRWGARPVASIARRDVLDVLDAEMALGRDRTANLLLALVRKIFNWAVERGIVEASPAAGIRAPGREVARDRVLDDDELARVWNAADSMGWPWAGVVQLLIVTAQRRDEVREARWSEIDIERRLWTIPRERVKLDRAHDVPLSDLALGIIDSLPRVGNTGLVFPAARAGSRNAISGLSQLKRKLDQLSGVGGWRLHDLRRTAASSMARLGHPPHVLAKVLNHAPAGTQGITALYNRYHYGDEQRAALEAWARHLERITSGAAAQVVVLRGGR
jgi:integrase